MAPADSSTTVAFDGYDSGCGKFSSLGTGGGAVEAASLVENVHRREVMMDVDCALNEVR